MVICCDFDGTVCTHEFPKVGKDIGAVPFLKALVENGHKLICFTMRGPGTKEEAEAKAWFEKNGIELYGFNLNPEQASWTMSRKVYAHVYIDDAALGCPLCYPETGRPFVDWVNVGMKLYHSGLLTGDQFAEAAIKALVAREELLGKGSEPEPETIISLDDL